MKGIGECSSISSWRRQLFNSYLPCIIQIFAFKSIDSGPSSAITYMQKIHNFKAFTGTSFQFCSSFLMGNVSLCVLLSRRVCSLFWPFLFEIVVMTVGYSSFTDSGVYAPLEPELGFLIILASSGAGVLVVLGCGVCCQMMSLLVQTVKRAVESDWFGLERP